METYLARSPGRDRQKRIEKWLSVAFNVKRIEEATPSTAYYAYPVLGGFRGSGMLTYENFMKDRSNDFGTRRKPRSYIMIPGG